MKALHLELGTPCQALLLTALCSAVSYLGAHACTLHLVQSGFGVHTN
jgi:hypothetical protein